jgi:hypothetical protein
MYPSKDSTIVTITAAIRMRSLQLEKPSDRLSIPGFNSNLLQTTARPFHLINTESEKMHSHESIRVFIYSKYRSTWRIVR